MKILFATGNADKMREIREILGGSGIEAVSLKEAGVSLEVEENGATFEENAIIKARACMELTGEIALADDSGLEVDAMNKAPGVHSARYMGCDTSYHVKNKSIIDCLEGKVGGERSARFVCAIAAVFPDGRILTTYGTMEGQIGYEERGENGFGYDPIFYLPEYGCYSAELSREKKNELSHRGKALRAMRDKLMAEWEKR
ncbi:MAG: RdgB/HAM1 family non-canonical purine NTP pyrophosphatase [Lachnospiraceae bacterium]|nr:RdgB/HAM1 family non-canonical purine NTP pyrophosphatase [Lachnospiraceae bacterium]